MTDQQTPDDADATRRHDLPTGADQPATPTTPSGTEPGGAADRFSPSPDPRPAWSRHEPGTAPAVTPERWYEPTPSGPADPIAPIAPVATVTQTPSQAAGASAGRSSRGATGSIVLAAALSAILASGGTVLTLSATGALDRPSASPAGASGTTVASGQPVTIDESSATIDVAAKVSPAVVRITTSSGVDTSNGIIPDTGVGSGVIYDAAGWILTNRHVVEGSEGLEVELSDGRVLSGTVYGIDTLTDLAIVKVEEAGLPTAALGDSDALKVGQLVVAIGSPLGTYSNSVTSGIVSAKGRSITTDGNQNLNNLIQTDAAINPGNSGGPLLDANGMVVGINTAIARDSNGIGFAIPIDIARPIMAQAVAGEELARPYMGVSYVTITRKLADDEGLPVHDGAWVGGGTGGSPAVQPGTPAADAGLQDGDIIVKIDGQVVDGEHPLDAALSQFAPEDTISLEVLRDGQTVTISLTLGTRPADL
jgi:S1-C subfamily serine protease